MENKRKLLQPKSLEELASKVINERVEYSPYLNDLPIPKRLIINLEERYRQDHLKCVEYHAFTKSYEDVNDDIYYLFNDKHYSSMM